MSQRTDKSNGNGFEPLAMIRSTRDTWLSGWSKLAIQFTSSDAYGQMTGAMLDGYLTLTGPYRQLLTSVMTRTLADLNMPSRTDVISLADRLTNIEMRLDDLDARIDELKRAEKDVH